MWTISTSVGSRALTLVATLVLTRFLAKDVYGEVMVAQVVVLSAHMFTQFGLGIYVVAHPNAERRTVFHATFYNLVTGALAIGAVVVLRDPIGRMTGAPNMGLFVPGLAIACVMDRLAYMPERILVRDLRFRLVSVQRSIGEVAYAGFAVGLAALHWGGIAIVVASLVRSFVKMVICVGATQRRDWLELHRLNKSDSRDLFAFGLPLSIGMMAYFAASRWDNLIVSGIFGASVAGAYNYAYNLADVPASNVGEQIGDVLLPSFAHLGEEQRKSALARAMTLLALLVFPLAIGLGAIGNTLTHAIFPPAWESVGPMLTVLSALSITRPIAWVINSYLQAQKRTRPIMLLEIFKVILILVLIPTLGRFDPLWACAMVGVTFGAHAFGSVWVVRRTDGIPMKSLLVPLVPPLLSCFVMVAAILAARHGLSLGTRSAVFALVVEVTVGALAFIAAALVLAKDASKDMLGLLRRSRARSSVPPAHGAA